MTGVDRSGAARTGVDPQRAAIAEAICWARREQQVSVRVLLERMDLPLSSSRYVRFESARRTLSEEVMASICRVLGLDLDQVAQDAAAAVTRANQPPAAEPAAAGPLRGAVPQVPAIRVKVEQLMSGEVSWLEPVRGMLALHAAAGTDSNGDLLLQEPLIRTIAQISGRTLLDCWAALSAFIEHDPPSTSNRATTPADR